MISQSCDVRTQTVNQTNLTVTETKGAKESSVELDRTKAKMAVQSSLLPLLSSLPKFSPNPTEASIRVSIPSRRFRDLGKRISPWRLKAGLSEIEPDLNEDPVDRWATNSISPEDFEYGVYDGHHTYFEGEDKGTFWGLLAEEYASVDPPTGFQGLISWLFLPAVAAGMYFNVPGEYLFIGAGLFTVVFCIIEMDKPDKPHNFEPQIYNMERGARDKLISDYNTMSIWDFNEKYGDLWDFTIKKDNITIRDR